MSHHHPILTTADGAPIADNQNALTAGARGPLLMQDVQLLEQMQHFKPRAASRSAWCTPRAPRRTAPSPSPTT